MLRRVRSGYAMIIELVSNVNIRSHCGLVNGDNVSLVVIGENPNKQLNLMPQKDAPQVS